MTNDNIYIKSNPSYKALFDKSPIPIHGTDVSDIASQIANLKNQGVEDIQIYLTKHPNFIYQLFINSSIFDVNEAMILLMEAESKTNYLQNFKAVLGKPCFEFFQQVVIALFSGKDTLTGETELTTFQGNKKYVEVHAIYHCLEGREIINYTFIDLTGKRKAATKLRNSEHRYKQLFANNIIGTAVTDKQFQFTEVNEAFCQMIGYTEIELKTIGFPNVTIPENLEESIELSRKLFAGEILDFTVFKSYRRKNGSIFRAKTFVKGLYDERGNFISSIASILDITEQKKAEDALMVSEQRYRLLFENAFEGIIIYDINKQEIIDCNDKVLELFGIEERADFLNTPLLKFSPARQPNKNLSSKVLIDKLMQAMEYGKVEYEWMYQRADGSQFYTRKYDIRLNTEKEQLFISIIKDITEEKQKDDAIELINNNLVQGDHQDSLNNLVLAMSKAFNIDHVFIARANDHITKATSLTYCKKGKLQNNIEFNLINSPCLEIYNTGEVVIYENNLQTYFPNNKAIEIWKGESYLGYPLFSKSGQLIGHFSLIHSQPIKNKALMCEIMGLYASWAGTEMERMENERALIKSETTLKNIINSTGDVFYVIDRHYRLIAFNPKAQITFKNLFGANLELEKTSIANGSNLNRAKIKRQIEIYNRAFDGEMVDILEEFDEHGKKQYFTSTYSPMRDAHGNVNGCIVVAKNITALKEAKAALNKQNIELEKYIESNTQLENFAYIASHDLKAPIRTVISFAQLLKRRLGNQLDERGQEYLEFIMSGSKSMKRLVDALLEYSRVNAQKYNFQNIVTNNLLNDVKFEIQTTIQDANAVVEIKNLPSIIHGDYIKIKQLFQNLITNGIKFQKPNKFAKIVIDCVEQTTAWEFSVKDNGIGIKPAFFDKIFSLFGKLNGQSEYEGTGIGLSICKTIVEQHGGRIWLDSKYGSGTTFYFTIAK